MKPDSTAPVVQQKDFEHVFKYIVVGDSGSGKTALVQRLCDDTFKESHIYTIGVDFTITKLSLSNGDAVKLQIWDTAGQERFHAIITSYYRGAQGVVIVYDISSKESLESISKWLQEVQRHCEDGVKVIVVGNKLDLCGDSKENYGKEALSQIIGVEHPDDPESWMNHGITGFHQTSAKSGNGVIRAFQDLTDAVGAKFLHKKEPSVSRRFSGASEREFHDSFDTQMNRRKRTMNRDRGSAKSGCCTIL